MANNSQKKLGEELDILNLVNSLRQVKMMSFLLLKRYQRILLPYICENIVSGKYFEHKRIPYKKKKQLSNE